MWFLPLFWQKEKVFSMLWCHNHVKWTLLCLLIYGLAEGQEVMDNNRRYTVFLPFIYEHLLKVVASIISYVWRCARWGPYHSIHTQQTLPNFSVRSDIRLFRHCLPNAQLVPLQLVLTPPLQSLSATRTHFSGHLIATCVNGGGISWL